MIAAISQVKSIEEPSIGRIDGRSNEKRAILSHEVRIDDSLRPFDSRVKWKEHSLHC